MYKKNEEPYIICSAIYFNDNINHIHQPKNITIGFVVCGRRHHNIFSTIKSLGVDRLSLGEHIQGFLTSDDRFVDRKEAAKIAYIANQINEPIEILYSEDIY